MSNLGEAPAAKGAGTDREATKKREFYTQNGWEERKHETKKRYDSRTAR